MSIWTCGPEDGERLGRPRENWDPGRVPIPEGVSVAQIALGWKHGHFFTDTNQFYSWGTGSSWRLGTGEQENLPRPTRITTFPEKIKFKQVACGDKFSACTTQQGELYAWGSGYAHVPTQLELPCPAEFIACGQIILLAALSDGTVMEFYRHSLPTLHSFGKDHIISVACGQTHRLALADSGHVYAWGAGSATGIGTSEIPKRIPTFDNITIQAIFAYHNSSYFIDTYGCIWACGTNSSNSLGLGHAQEVVVPTRMTFEFSREQIIQIACGDDFTLFLSAQGNVWACGNGGDFRNATGSVETRPIPVPATKLAGKFITQIAAGCFNTAVLENGYPPFNRMARFRGFFSEFAIPVLPFRATMGNMASVEINPSDELLRPLGFMTRDIVRFSPEKQAMVVGVAQGKPAVICEGANEIALIEADITCHPIISRPGVHLFVGTDEKGNSISVDPSEKETLRLGGFMYGDILDDDSVVVGARCNAIWTLKDGIIQKRDHTTLNIKKRKAHDVIVKTMGDGSRYVLDSMKEDGIVVIHTTYGAGTLMGKVGKLFCYEFVDKNKCTLMDSSFPVVRLSPSANMKVEYLLNNGERVFVDISDSKEFIPLDRVKISHKNSMGSQKLNEKYQEEKSQEINNSNNSDEFGTVVGSYENMIVVRTDKEHLRGGTVTLYKPSDLKLMARILKNANQNYKFKGQDIVLDVSVSKCSQIYPNDRIEVDGKRGYVAGSKDGTNYILFDGDEEVTPLDKEFILIRRCVDVAGHQLYGFKDVDVSLMNFAMSIMKPGDVRKHMGMRVLFLGYDRDQKMIFKSLEGDTSGMTNDLTPSLLDIEYIEVDK
ncbi:hypothetical protein TVAG_553920 [Trichomonas vaginalis G3]|uniref:RCC1-like domain-containing protein n=1 Tax=Trichomonas vaginalis (strain ATCC PRA-98 / G3) TaxID=412133 RepID=A2G9F1_TRIV3|nr:ubiquitin-protein transferase protein [Trichomonas vaginalis G3]EAX86216.1 hypothetical protein TVAG_553920 [Trichomonas vaginalis G3]KAI5535911.1 ubiquitin-protein transferase protein [Trichomonas vaginalis G3]|eukprot:XP_001299146.1 hypothetical protein [Trichomonas vaginalis G3]